MPASQPCKGVCIRKYATLLAPTGLATTLHPPKKKQSAPMALLDHIKQTRWQFTDRCESSACGVVYEWDLGQRRGESSTLDDGIGPPDVSTKLSRLLVAHARALASSPRRDVTCLDLYRATRNPHHAKKCPILVTMWAPLQGTISACATLTKLWSERVGPLRGSRSMLPLLL